MCFIASKGNLPQQGPCKRKFNVNAKLLFIFKQGQIHQMKLNKNDSKTELTESSSSFQRTESLTYLFSVVYNGLSFHAPHLFKEAARYHQ